MRDVPHGIMFALGAAAAIAAVWLTRRRSSTAAAGDASSSYSWLSSSGSAEAVFGKPYMNERGAK
jgi:hypothetical protein